MSHDPKPPESYLSLYKEETFSDNIARQFRTKPAVLTGIGAMIGALGYGFYRWKTKGFLVSPSMFLMQLRVGAQSAVVGCLTIAMAYNLINKHVLTKTPEK